jgi:hypothetical protein
MVRRLVLRVGQGLVQRLGFGWSSGLLTTVHYGTGSIEGRAWSPGHGPSAPTVIRELDPQFRLADAAELLHPALPI